jgi:hypothetical protein
MKMNLKKMVAGIVFLVCLVTFSSCGYFLYPERRGQTGGNIDVAILALDCAGFFFGILPGAIALAVDFSSGAIYLPAGKTRDIKVTYVDKTMLTKEGYLEKVLSKELGKDIHLDGDMILVKSNPGEDVKATLSYLNNNISNYSTICKFVQGHNQYYASK